MTSSKRFNIFHPFMFGIFPVLFLYSRNVTEMRFNEILLPMAIVIAVVGVVMLLGMVVKNRDKLGLAVTASVIFFFTYGTFHSVLGELFAAEGEIKAVSDYVSFASWLLLFLFVIVMLLRLRADVRPMTSILNRVAVVLLVVQVGTAVYGLVNRGEGVAGEAVPSDQEQAEQSLPDLYYIILDGYARQDVLQDIYSLDNSSFTEALTKRGFYVADSSLANYCSTAQSLTSTLNLDYLQRILPADRGSHSRMPTAIMLENNKITAYLRRRGYTTVAFGTGYAPSEMEQADKFLTSGLVLSEFHNHLVNATPLPLILRQAATQFDLHRRQITYTLSKLRDLGEIESPKFVFAHVCCPHPPFVFGRQGEPLARQWPFSLSDGDHYFRHGATVDHYVKSYVDQLQYVSDQILVTIDSILTRSERPPIIVLQSDHGPGSRLSWEGMEETDLKERFGILNAYYVPGADTTKLYETITPVNSYRFILNEYFGTSYEYLPDFNYYTTWTRPYNYLDVTANLTYSYGKD